MQKLEDVKHKALSFLFLRVLKTRWIVDSEGCLGLRVAGVNLVYKWPDPVIITNAPWRFAEKREFGESVHSRITPNGIE